MAEMNLVIETTPATVETIRKHGIAVFDVIDKKLVIKHGDEKIFDEKPCNGKKWSVTVRVGIVETDV